VGQVCSVSDILVKSNPPITSFLSVFRADTAAFYIQICSEDHKFLELNDAQLDSELTPRGYEFVSERPVSTSFPRTRLGETRDDKFYFDRALSLGKWAPLQGGVEE